MANGPFKKYRVQQFAHVEIASEERPFEAVYNYDLHLKVPHNHLQRDLSRTR